MAKVNISIEIDTEEQTMDVSVNGKSINNVNYVSCYKYHDSYENEDCVSCNITANEKDEEGGISKTTTYYTSMSEEAKKIAKTDAILNPDLPNFVGKVEIDPTEALAKFFNSKSRFGV